MLNHHWLKYSQYREKDVKSMDGWTFQDQDMNQFIQVRNRYFSVEIDKDDDNDDEKNLQ